jgi:hypothetical protein
MSQRRRYIGRLVQRFYTEFREAPGLGRRNGEMYDRCMMYKERIILLTYAHNCLSSTPDGIHNAKTTRDFPQVKTWMGTKFKRAGVPRPLVKHRANQRLYNSQFLDKESA